MNHLGDSPLQGVAHPKVEMVKASMCRSLTVQQKMSKQVLDIRRERLGWNSTEKLVVSWVLVGGDSGAPAGGSAVGPVLVAARYTTMILYR